jgi:hypothetical protein
LDTNKFKKTIKEAVHLNAYFALQKYTGNTYLDVICTMIAFDLDDGRIDEEVVDHIPKLIRQIRDVLIEIKKASDEL